MARSCLAIKMASINDTIVAAHLLGARSIKPVHPQSEPQAHRSVSALRTELSVQEREQ